jgi:DNA-binding FrmR family transcriptional regulator
MKPNTKKLIDHISRLEGQLASIKKELATTEPDCEKTALTLKAASRSFSTLRMSFVSCFLEHTYLTKQQGTDKTYQALMHVINA